MNSLVEQAQEITKHISQRGLAGAGCLLERQIGQSLQYNSGCINRMNNWTDYTVRLFGIDRNRKGFHTINSLNPLRIERAIDQLTRQIENSSVDEGYQITPYRKSVSVVRGEQASDRDGMFHRLDQLIDDITAIDESIVVGQAAIEHIQHTKTFVNSEGISHCSKTGTYYATIGYTSDRYDRSSSQAFHSCALNNLHIPIIQVGRLHERIYLSHRYGQIGRLDGTFTGDVIITPYCLGIFVDYLVDHLQDFALISGISLFADSVGSTITHEQFTLRSCPVSIEIAESYYFTGDGYEAHDVTIIENGILQTHLLSLYGALKLGGDAVPNRGGCYSIAAGTTMLDDMIKSIDRGIILGRISIGTPSENGNFTGVVKNSYHIEGGEIKHQVCDTIISGNIKTLFEQIAGISMERSNDGFNCFPWILCNGLTITGSSV